MATFRERPYGRFNFVVEGLGGDVQAGFMEVTGLGVDIEVAEYRAGNANVNAPIKLTGLYKVPDVTLKRGVIGALGLWEWLKAVRDGDQNAPRDVAIILLSEDRQEVQRWHLRNARPIRYVGPRLDAQSSDEVAVEEFTLASEGIEMA